MPHNLQHNLMKECCIKKDVFTVLEMLCLKIQETNIFEDSWDPVT